jgi:hypothetical protein
LDACSKNTNCEVHCNIVHAAVISAPRLASNVAVSILYIEIETDLLTHTEPGVKFYTLVNYLK